MSSFYGVEGNRIEQDGEVFDTRLHCFVDEIKYNFLTCIGEVHMPECNCVDSTGCAELFDGIDPNVKEIRTYAGKMLDTVYGKANGKWVVLRAG